jgi:hypothetical protein
LTLNKDIRAENFCITALEQNVFRNLEMSEAIRPSARKIYGDRTIYRGPDQVIPQLLGVPVLCDFGEARFGRECYHDSIQPFMYQAPEVVFMIPWSYPADIWNAGVMVSILTCVYSAKSDMILVSAMGAFRGEETAFSSVSGERKLSTTCGGDGWPDGRTICIISSALTP